MNTNYTDPLEVYTPYLIIRDVIDAYDSFVWTDAYCGYGDFELKIPCEIAKKYKMDIGDFIRCTLSNTVMIIEAMSVESNDDNSLMVTYKGRSLESLLCRRVLRKEDVPQIVPQYNSSSQKYEAAQLRYVQEVILYVLNRTIVQNNNISMRSRGIEQLGYTINQDESIAEMKAPYVDLDGMTVFNFVQSVLAYNGLGFKIEFNPAGTVGGSVDNRVLLFSIYQGTNRSHTQTVNDRVIFSTDDDTTFKMDTSMDMSSYGNAALLVGPNKCAESRDDDDQPIIVETNKRFTTELYSGVTGINRYEIYVDTTNIPATNEYTERLYPESYILAQMRFRGIQSLKQHLSNNMSFTPSVDFDPYKKYGEDYNIGDIVSVIDYFGNINIVRVGSFSYSVDNSGVQLYPNFEAIAPIGGYRAIEQTENDEDVVRQLETDSDPETSEALRVTEHNNIELFDDTEIT